MLVCLCNLYMYESMNMHVKHAYDIYVKHTYVKHIYVTHIHVKHIHVTHIYVTHI
jgi:hypothetical protein